MVRQPLFEYPYSPRTIPIGDQHMCCVDEGRGPAVVMVHGNPSWSYLYRNLIPLLSPQFRCVAPDHIGCGFSAKPQRYPYRLAQHVANLETLLDYLEVERCVLVVHDWGGAIGMGWAGRHPERVAGMVVLNTAAFAADRIPLRIRICRWPIVGTLLVRGLNGFARAAVSMAVHRPMRPERAAGFLAPYDSWANRVAIHRFVQDIPMDERHPSWRDLAAIETGLAGLVNHPLLLCWGGRDFCFDDYFFDQWQRRFPNAEAHYFADAGHYVLEDALDEIGDLLLPFCRRCLS